MPVENIPWLKQALAALGVLAVAIGGWFWRFVMGHNKRISDLEKSNAVMNAHLENIEKSLEKGVAAIERMEQRHREDIVRAYEHIEKLHIVVIESLATAAANNNKGGDGK